MITSICCRGGFLCWCFFFKLRTNTKTSWDLGMSQSDLNDGHTATTNDDDNVKSQTAVK